MAELLKVEGLSAGYGEAVVLHGVSLSINAGETLALLGRNGTGKTTLINTLAGATRQHGGSISLGGAPLNTLAPHLRAAAGIGFKAESFDGVDLGPALSGKAQLRERTLFWRYGKNIAIRQGRWKLVRQGGAQFQLFDLDADLAETTDLAAKEAAIASRLEAALKQWNEQQAPPLWS